MDETSLSERDLADRDLAAMRSMIDELRATVDRQQRELNGLRSRITDSEHSPSARPLGSGSPPVDARPAVSRRALFGLTGAGLAGLAVAGSARPAGAADTEPVIQGADNAADSTTRLTHDASTGPVLDVEILSAGNEEPTLRAVSNAIDRGCAIEATAAGTLPIALHATATGLASYGIAASGGFIGVAGAANSTEFSGFGAGVVGGGESGTVGGWFQTDAGPQLFLEQFDPEQAYSGPPIAGSSFAGMIFADADGDLWLCTSSGEPGAWTRLNHQTPVHFDTPQRGYDSRKSGGMFAAGETRTVDLAASTDLPTDAGAAIVTLSITQTVGAGHASVYSAGAPTLSSPTFASITWTGSNQLVTNTLPVRVDGGQLKVYVHRPAHVVIDVVGHQDVRSPETPVATASQAMPGQERRAPSRSDQSSGLSSTNWSTMVPSTPSTRTKPRRSGGSSAE